MSKYKHTGSVDFFEKEKPDHGWVVGLIFVVIIILIAI